jgi:hypothetical protein
MVTTVLSAPSSGHSIVVTNKSPSLRLRVPAVAHILVARAQSLHREKSFCSQQCWMASRQHFPRSGRNLSRENLRYVRTQLPLVLTW